MNTRQERCLGELAESIFQLTDKLPTMGDEFHATDLATFDELDDAAKDLWVLWREVQVERDLAPQH